MNLLDNIQKIKELDPSSVLESTVLLPEQIKQAWDEIFQAKMPPSCFKGARNIIVAGMGGSALGARIIDSLNFEVLDLPLEIVNGYHLPAYADKNSLIIISSYSGNTEETLSCCLEAIKKKSQIFIISSGGKLSGLAKKNNLPAYIFQTRYNPSGQPRLGLGYSIAAQLALLSKCRFVRLGEAQITEAINYLHELREKISVEVEQKENIAKKTASLLRQKAIVLVSAEHLNGATHTFKNMLNETSKTFAVRFSLPEMNHHLLEGLSYPVQNKKWLKFLFFISEIYDPEIKKRVEITKEVIEKNGLSCLSLRIRGRTRLVQVFETIYLGGFISFYLAMLYRVDPAHIPWVDFFKSKLAAHAKER